MRDKTEMELKILKLESENAELKETLSQYQQPVQAIKIDDLPAILIKQGGLLSHDAAKGRMMRGGVIHD